MKMIGMSYKIYEVSKECRNGKLMKEYHSEKLAIKFMENSIYRYMKKEPIYE